MVVPIDPAGSGVLDVGEGVVGAGVQDGHGEERGVGLAVAVAEALPAGDGLSGHLGPFRSSQTRAGVRAEVFDKAGRRRMRVLEHLLHAGAKVLAEHLRVAVREDRQPPGSPPVK